MITMAVSEVYMVSFALLCSCFCWALCSECSCAKVERECHSKKDEYMDLFKFFMDACKLDNASSTAILSEMENIKQRLDLLEGRQGSVPVVLFRAKTIPDYQIRPTQNQIFRFTDVMANVGNGYDPATGIFTSPTTGTYLITVQFCFSLNFQGFYFVHDIIADGITVLRSNYAEETGKSSDCQSHDIYLVN
ncbi:hypothetical protein MAR_006440 [Mya arenaria]|uniref:C1q domain-containing protein n=1 Tax=Mya arenaria TaxID=6604 RepID=A0ABY7D9D3_MYAAR|nr:hypothetical protein MAR_006440 [Mya arenaria]